MSRTLTGAILASLLSILTLNAQTPHASVVGRILDASGAVVPRADIAIHNTGTNEVRRTVSDDSGEFLVPNLPPGVFHVEVKKDGFRTLRQENLELQVDQAARLELRLEVGSVADTIKVTASAPLINTENAVKGEVVSRLEITEMPLISRDFHDLAFLVPGVTERAEGSGYGSGISANGARYENTNFIIDGMSNYSYGAGAQQARPNVDAMQEFKMQTSGYSAQYGRLAGGIVNMTLRTGTNRFHGSLYEFFRNDALDARAFFNPSKAKLRQNDFGATLAGPVLLPKLYNGRDRTFFLFSWESALTLNGVTQLSVVPTDLQRQGDFSQTTAAGGGAYVLRDPYSTSPCTATNRAGCFPNNIIPASRIDPIGRKIAAYYPRPNYPGANNFIAIMNSDPAWHGFNYKIDHRLTDRDNVSARYLIRYQHIPNPFQGSTLGTFGYAAERPQSLYGVNWTHLFSPTVIHEARVSLSRTLSTEQNDSHGHDYAKELGITGVTSDPKLVGFPVFSVTGMATVGDASGQPRLWAANGYAVGDTLTVVRGRHEIKLGADVLRSQYFQVQAINARGTFSFLGRQTNEPLADLLLGLPSSTSRQVGTNPNYLFNTNIGLFVQDDIRATPRLTVNIGLRYEILKPVYDKFGRWANYLPDRQIVAIADDIALPDMKDILTQAKVTDRFGLAKNLGLPGALVYTNYDNFAPRLGIAWRPFGGNKFVIRTGYGLYYGATSVGNLPSFFSGFPFTVSQSFSYATTDPNALTLSNPFPISRVVIGGTANTNGYQVRPPTPYQQSWSLTLERELGRMSAIEIGYGGSKGTHLARQYDINQALRDPALRTSAGFPRPNMAFTTINYYSFGASSAYHALTTTLRRRLAANLFFNINYIFSKSLDHASQSTGTGTGGYGLAQDSRNLTLEYGRSDFDIAHRATYGFNYETPKTWFRLARSWQVAGTGILRTGLPFTPRVATVLLDQGEANRPDRIRKGTISNPTIQGWYDISAFPRVPLNSFRFGNSGRNILTGPNFIAPNVALMKRFYIREQTYLQFRWEAFDFSNTPAFNLPVIYVDQRNAGTITGTKNNRSMQLALKLVF
jgi:hypothetical protein